MRLCNLILFSILFVNFYIQYNGGKIRIRKPLYLTIFYALFSLSITKDFACGKIKANILFMLFCTTEDFVKTFARATSQGAIHLVRKSFRKTNISYPLIRTRTCTYQRVRNVSFSENVLDALNE